MLVLTFFPVEHTSVLDRVVVEDHLIETSVMAQSNRLGAV
jgi:hypothetical protein